MIDLTELNHVAGEQGYYVREGDTLAAGFPTGERGYGIFDASSNIPLAGWDYDLTDLEVMDWLKQ